MSLEERNKIVLKKIVDVEKYIFDIYFKGTISNDIKIGLLRQALFLEEMYFSHLNLSNNDVQEVEEFIFSQLKRHLPSDDMLIGVASTLSEATYPYYRLVARIRNMFLPNNEEVLLDCEVRLFYMLLSEFIVDNPSLEIELKEYMNLILIDSKNVENEVLKNNFLPCSEITMVESLKKFKQVFPKVILKLLFEIKYSDEPVALSADFQMKLIHFKTVLSFLSPEMRENLNIREELLSINISSFENEFTVLEPYLNKVKQELSDDIAKGKIHYLKRIK